MVRRKLPDLRKPFECLDCATGLGHDADFLFDPRTAVLLAQLSVRTLGFHRWHHHINYAPRRDANQLVSHFFTIYQTVSGQVCVMDTVPAATLRRAVLWATRSFDYPTLKELELYGV